MRLRAKGPSIQIAWAKAISVGLGIRTNTNYVQAQRAGRSVDDRRWTIERLARWAVAICLCSLTWPAASLWARLEGSVEEARQDFAKATDGTTNLRVLFLATEFYVRTGDWTTAEQIIERRLAISGPDAENAETARALGNRGVIYDVRNQPEQAEAMYQKALGIDEKLRNEEGIARHSGNLGVIYRERGDLIQAEKMYSKALDIDEKLSNEEGIARHCGNLGLVHRSRGELAKAEEMHRKARDINEKLGLQEQLASNYANLGLVAKDRGESEMARELWTKARDLYARIGMSHKVQKWQEWIDQLPHPVV